MDLYVKIFALFFILTSDLLLSSSLRQSGRHLKSKKGNGPKPSYTIGENPFLQGHLTTTAAPAPLYQGNPFLSNTRAPEALEDTTTHHPHTVAQHGEEYRAADGPLYVNNPFLHSGTNGPVTRPPNTDQIHFPLANGNRGSNVVNQPPVSERPFISPLIDGSTKTKSEAKCDEYARQVAATTGVLSLVGTNPAVSEISFDNCRSVNRLVINGDLAAIGEYPHMVALGRTEDDKFSYQCGATLIAPEWVLTAAHCTYGPSGGPTVARVGLNDLTETQSGISSTIKTIIRHPSYKPPAMYADIALIKLEVAIKFSDKIRPACLYQSYDTAPLEAWVSGWGVTEFGGDQSDKLQKARLDVVDNFACTVSHNRSIAVPYGVSPSMICAGDAKGGWMKDTCSGDSGGPLQVIHPDNGCLYQIVGVTSFGQGCAMINSPGVYTRVSHYLTWIEEHVWPDT